jgi:Flp pilus assembly protein TadD
MGPTISRVAGLVLGATVAFSGAVPGAAAVSVDVLRHPISAKVRRVLMGAMRQIESGNHDGAIEQLQVTLAKYPDSAAWVLNLLGVEYVKTDQFEAAVRSLEQAVLLLPHDAMTHYNFGLALICSGDHDRAETEIRRAVELDPENAQMQARLHALVERGALVEHRRSGE